MKGKSVFTKVKPYLYLIPMLTFFIVFVVGPTIYTVYLSFFDWNMVSPNKEFVGFDNYTRLFTDEIFHKVLLNTSIYIVLLLIINFIVPYIFAFVCRFILGKFQGFYKSVFFLPGFISLVVSSMIFTWLLNPISGPIADIVKFFGMDMPIWTATDGLVIVVISFITSWKCFGYNFITLFAAVSGVSTEIIEVAKLDNIPLHKIFMNIVAPVTGSTSFYILIMTIVQGLTYVYSPIQVLTRGGPNYGSSNIIYDSYFKAFSLFETGESAALSVMTLLVFGVGLYILREVVAKKVYYEN